MTSEEIQNYLKNYKSRCCHFSILYVITGQYINGDPVWHWECERCKYQCDIVKVKIWEGEFNNMTEGGYIVYSDSTMQNNSSNKIDLNHKRGKLIFIEKE